MLKTEEELQHLTKFSNKTEDFMYQCYLFDLEKEQTKYCWYIPGTVSVLETLLKGKLVLGRKLISSDDTQVFDVVLSEEFQSEMGVLGDAVIIAIEYVKGRI